MNVLLFAIAYTLFLPITLINYVVLLCEKDSTAKGYFRSSAIDLDKYGNREFRTLWNASLITDKGYQFGRSGETISSVLGKNLLKGTLTKTGKALVWLLDTIQKNHCINAITNQQ